MNIAALIPAYREENHIADVVRRTRQYLSRVLVVDDGSGDRTADIARQAGAEVVVNPENMGKGASLVVGLDRLFAEGADAVMCLDADGQHLPEEIPRFLAAADPRALILGNRMADLTDMPFVRRCTNRLLSGIVGWLTGVPVPDSQCGFRLVGRDAWQGVTIHSRNYDFESEMIVAMGRKGFRVDSVPVSTVYGDEVSTINPVRDTVRFFKMVWRLWRSG